MHLPSKSLRSVALFMPLSEAKPRSADRSLRLSWFVVPENAHINCHQARLSDQRRKEAPAGLQRLGAGDDRPSGADKTRDPSRNTWADGHQQGRAGKATLGVSFWTDSDSVNTARHSGPAAGGLDFRPLQQVVQLFQDLKVFRRSQPSRNSHPRSSGQPVGPRISGAIAEEKD